MSKKEQKSKISSRNKKNEKKKKKTEQELQEQFDVAGLDQVLLQDDLFGDGQLYHEQYDEHGVRIETQFFN